MAVPSERPNRHSDTLEAFADSDFLTLVESDLQHQTDTVLPAVQVSAEDKDFIDRVFSQVRDVDFRAPPPPPQALDGHEKKIGDLREKVRKLERDLARVAHVWQQKHQQMHALDDILAKADAARHEAVQTCRRVKEQAIHVVNAYKQQTQAAQSLAQTLGARKNELELNYQRLSEDHAQMSSRLTEQVAKLEREQARSTEEYRQKLESAQETFNQLREQSAHHIGMLQAEVKGRDETSALQQQEIQRLQGLLVERDAHLESVRAGYVADHDALRDSSAAALEALRASSAAAYAALEQSTDAAAAEQKASAEAAYNALRQGSDAALAELKASGESAYRALEQSSAAAYDALKESSEAKLADFKAASDAAYDTLRNQSVAKYEALLESSSAKYESLVNSGVSTLEAQRSAAAAALETVKANAAADYQALETQSATRYEALRESSQGTLDALRITSNAAQEDLSRRLADLEKVEAVARTRIAALEDQVRERDTQLTQSEHRFLEADREHRQRIATLEASSEQFRDNAALDQATLRNQLSDAQREAATCQARLVALEAQARDREDSVRSVTERLAERERTTAQLIDELGIMRVEQERRLAEKGEALRAGYDEVARLQGGLAQMQTELAQLQSHHDTVVTERDAFRKLVPPDAV